jgi:hypothetical protein
MTFALAHRDCKQFSEEVVRKVYGTQPANGFLKFSNGFLNEHVNGSHYNMGRQKRKIGRSKSQMPPQSHAIETFRESDGESDNPSTFEGAFSGFSCLVLSCDCLRLRLP